MATTDIPANEFAYRLGKVEQKADSLEASKADASDVLDLLGEVKGIRKLLVKLLVSVTSASLIFGFGAIEIAINLHK
jgi:hypothetical protein